MKQFDPIGPLEDLEEAFRRLNEDKPERLRFFVFTGALVAIALACLIVRGSL